MSVIPLRMEAEYTEVTGGAPPVEHAHPESSPSTDRRRYARQPHHARPAADLGRSPLPLPLRIRPLPGWKRAVDLVGAVLCLMLLSPFMLVIAAAVKLTSRGPVIFRQKRAGLGGKPFVIYKFRTMVAEASEAGNEALRRFNEQDGPVFKMRNDPRLTPLGKLLRRSSLDELPQLWNVVRGEMSLVGPRPLEWGEAMACDAWEQRRLEVTPGITCIWQISGRSNLTFAQWIRMDLEYIRRRSLLLDAWILLKTIPAVLSRRGAR